MEKATPAGLIAGFVLVFGAIFMGDGWATFLDPVSLLIVLGGTVAGILVTFSFDEIKLVIPAFKTMLGFQQPDYGSIADQIGDFARTARRDGLLALDSRLDEAEDPLLRAALEMAVDGVPVNQANTLLRTRMSEATTAPVLLTKLLNRAGTYAPAFGMVGTLIGLIQMLQNLNDPSAIGPAMAVAMITTFYGAFFANLVFLPMAGKVQGQVASRSKSHEMIRIGAIGILEGTAPGALAQRLSLYVDGKPAEKGGEPAPTPLRKAA